MNNSLTKLAEYFNIKCRLINKDAVIMTNKQKYYSFTNNKKLVFVIMFAFILFIIGQISPNLGMVIYLILRWMLFLAIPTVFIYEIVKSKKQKINND